MGGNNMIQIKNKYTAKEFAKQIDIARVMLGDYCNRGILVPIMEHDEGVYKHKYGEKYY